MQPDFERSAAAMVVGTEKAIQSAIAPLLKRLEALEAQPAPERGEKGEPGVQGIGIVANELRDGVLILRLSDGSQQEVGSINGKDGEPGKDAEPPSIDAIAETFRETAENIVSEAVAAGLAKVPPPEKGEKGDQGEPGLAGADGRGWAKSFIDRDGSLIATFSDGSIENLGNIIGKDGEPGRDGFSLDDFDCEPIDERTIKLKFVRGDIAHSFELEFPVIIDRGVFRSGEVYKRGDAVTWGGSLWIAQVETGEKPDANESGWRLAVRKGRDGKDAKA